MYIDMLSIIAWFTATLILVFGPIILIHELGHFLTAKRAGVRVEEFGFGFPPRLLTLAGEKGTMEIDSFQLTIPGRFRLPFLLEKGTWVEARARKSEDGTYELSHLTVPKNPEEVSSRKETGDEIAVQGKITALDRGTQYTLNLLPFGAFVRMTGEEDPSDTRSLAAQPKLQRLGVILGGSVANLLAAFLLLATAYMVGSPEQYYTRVDEVEPSSAAAAAGFQLGDIVTSIDNTRLISGSIQLRDAVMASAEETVLFTVIRAGEDVILEATPRLVDGHGYLGIAMREWPSPEGIVHYSFPVAVTAAAQDMATIVVRLVQLPGLLFQGEVTTAEVRPASAVGINALLTFTLQQSIEWGVAFPTLSTAAIVSFILGITNMLPIPAFDGGRAVFVLIEAVRKRRVNPELEARIHFVTLMVMLVLLAFVMVQDVINPIIAWSLLSR